MFSFNENKKFKGFQECQGQWCDDSEEIALIKIRLIKFLKKNIE